MTDQSTFKKEKLKEEHFYVAGTRKYAEYGSDEKVRRMWLALQPFFNKINIGKPGANLGLKQGVPENMGLVFSAVSVLINKLKNKAKDPKNVTLF